MKREFRIRPIFTFGTDRKIAFSLVWDGGTDEIPLVGQVAFKGLAKVRDFVALCLLLADPQRFGVNAEIGQITRQPAFGDWFAAANFRPRPLRHLR